MPNLVQDLGPDYINQMYSGAMFAHEEGIFYLERANRDGVLATRLDSPMRQVVNLPHDAFADMSKFAWAAPGYRNFAYKKHNLLLDAGVQRSAKRGLRAGLVQFAGTRVTNLFFYDEDWRNQLSGNVPIAELMLRPKYYSYATAKQMIADGDAVGVAISHTLAIELNPFSKNAGECSVLFRGAKIGSISPAGEFNIPARFISRLTNA